MRRITFIIFIVFMSGIFAGCASAPSDKPKELSKSERARLFVEIANQSLLERDFTGSLQSLAQAEQLDESLPEIYHTKSLVYFAKKELSRSIEHARKAIALKPNFSDAHNTLGKLLMDAGSSDAAEIEKHFKQAAEDPFYRDAFKAHTHLGLLHFKRFDFEKAKKHFEKAVNEAPLQACIAYYYLGQIELDRENFQESIQNYQKASGRFCSKFEDAHLALGMVYEKNRQFVQARKKYLDIQQIFPRTKTAQQAMERMSHLP